jgi:hypothetical protein
MTDNWYYSGNNEPKDSDFKAIYTGNGELIIINMKKINHIYVRPVEKDPPGCTIRIEYDNGKTYHRFIDNITFKKLIYQLGWQIEKQTI